MTYANSGALDLLNRPVPRDVDRDDITDVCAALCCITEAVAYSIFTASYALGCVSSS